MSKEAREQRAKSKGEDLGFLLQKGEGFRKTKFIYRVLSPAPYPFSFFVDS
jgi:hypothetical protein